MTGIDWPWLSADVLRAPAFSGVEGYFAREITIAGLPDAEDPDVEEPWEAAHYALGGALTLIDPTGDRVPWPTLHLDPRTDTAWWR